MPVSDPMRLQNSGEGVRTLTASAISELVGGELRGDGSIAVRSVAPLDRAGPENVSFLASAKYASLYRDSYTGVLLVDPELADSPGKAAATIVVKKPHEAVLVLLPLLYPQPSELPAIHSTAQIGRGAKLGENVVIEDYVIIGNDVTISDDCRIGSHSVIGAGVTIGAKTRLYPQVTIYSGATLGERVMVHSGARIASDGFGYVQKNGAHEKIQHIGRCIVGNDVEIGANTTIDRGSIDDTVIGAGTKIDNLVHIAHNVRIGKLCLIMAQVGIAGSVHVEDGCILAGQVGLSGHLTIGKGARLGAQAGVFGDVPAGETWSGYPARPHRESLRASAALFKLGAIMKRLERLLDEQDGK